MKKKYIIITSIIIAILVIVASTFAIIHISNKNKYDAIKYGRSEFVTSMKDIKKDLPTIILFKSSLVENSVKAEKNLKLLHDEYGSQFNIVHANSDALDNEEAVELAKKYQVTGVPTLVALDRDGNFIEKKSDISSMKGIENMLKDMGVNIDNKG